MSKSIKTEPTATAILKPGPQTKRYDAAFKQQAVENWIKTGKPGRQIAQELGISYPSLKEWKRCCYGDATPQRDDLTAELRALKAELARVREQRDILKNGGHLHRTVQERYQAIARMKAEHPLAQLYAAFAVKRSGYHAWVNAEAGLRARADAQLLPQIRAVHQQHRAATESPVSRKNWPPKARGTGANASPG